MSVRNRLSPEVKTLFMEYCDSKEIHSVLNVTYKDVAERIVSWLSKQPIETWNNVIEIMEKEILASRGKCFTGRLSRLVSCLDGNHPGVRISIATADQISNRVLMVVNKGKVEKLPKERVIEMVKKELEELDVSDTDMEAWLSTVEDKLEES